MVENADTTKTSKSLRMTNEEIRNELMELIITKGNAPSENAELVRALQSRTNKPGAKLNAPKPNTAPKI